MNVREEDGLVILSGKCSLITRSQFADVPRRDMRRAYRRFSCAPIAVLGVHFYLVSEEAEMRILLADYGDNVYTR